MPDRLPTFGGDPNNDHDIDEFALEVRHAADINGDIGVPNVTGRPSVLGVSFSRWRTNWAST